MSNEEKKQARIERDERIYKSYPAAGSLKNLSKLLSVGKAAIGIRIRRVFLNHNFPRACDCETCILLIKRRDERLERLAQNPIQEPFKEQLFSNRKSNYEKLLEIVARTST